MSYRLREIERNAWLVEIEGFTRIVRYRDDPRSFAPWTFARSVVEGYRQLPHCSRPSGGCECVAVFGSKRRFSMPRQHQKPLAPPVRNPEDVPGTAPPAPACVSSYCSRERCARIGFLAARAISVCSCAATTATRHLRPQQGATAQILRVNQDAQRTLLTDISRRRPADSGDRSAASCLGRSSHLEDGTSGENDMRKGALTSPHLEQSPFYVKSRTLYCGDVQYEVYQAHSEVRFALSSSQEAALRLCDVLNAAVAVWRGNSPCNVVG
jgi:hypothetical protein